MNGVQRNGVVFLAEQDDSFGPFKLLLHKKLHFEKPDESEHSLATKSYSGIIYGTSGEVTPLNNVFRLGCTQQLCPMQFTSMESVSDLFLLTFRGSILHTGSVFVEYDKDDISIVKEEDNGCLTVVLAGSLHGVEGPVQTEPPISLLDVFLRHAYRNRPTTYTLPTPECDTAVVYAWKTSSATAQSIVHVSSVGGDTNSSLQLGSVALLKSVGDELAIHLLDHIDACRLIILWSKRTTSI
ncbi:unnamed protein product [Dicrocoelium dendriticum]|nr:unnamed protein product [Dicrocoelium dendriticum]